jgi:hypothetical protein
MKTNITGDFEQNEVFLFITGMFLDRSVAFFMPFPHFYMYKTRFEPAKMLHYNSKTMFCP